VTSNQLSEKSFWDQEWRNRKENDMDFVFGELFRKYLPHSGGTFFEVGCAPGRIMCYFHKIMEYQVNGIDYSSIKDIEDYLINNGIENFKLYDGDFTQTTIEEEYDVVASFGFIEHFVDIQDIIERHKTLVKKNGYLILQVPNLRFFNWLLYRIFNPKLLNIHNLKAMELDTLRRAVGEGYECLYAGYYKTCFVSFQEDNTELDKRPLLKTLFLAMKKTMSFFQLENIPNRFFSPYIVMITKNKE
jgi:2-polyprenyl-3-methyl-5-hydroxy-6-metoxy-1,4-benzoquinol methylase